MMRTAIAPWNWPRAWQLAFILLVGLAARLLLAPFTYHPWDYGVWQQTAVDMVSSGDLYPKHYAYLPLWGFVLAAVGAFLQVVGGLSLEWERVAFKAPLIASDVLVALVLYRMVREEAGHRRAITAAAAWFLNPFVIFISSGWSMFDTLAALFSLLALDSMLRGKVGRGGIWWGLALATKQYAVVLLPIFALFLLRRRSLRQVVLGLGLSGAIPLAMSLPYLLDDFSLFLRQVVLYHGVRLAEGASFWTALRELRVPGFEEVGPVSLLPMVLLLGAVYFETWRTKGDPSRLPALMTAAVLAFLATSKVVNPQYQVWPLAFLPLMLAAHGNPIDLLLFSTLALATLLPSPLSMFFGPVEPAQAFLARFDWAHPKSEPGRLLYSAEGILASTAFLAGYLRYFLLSRSRVKTWDS